MLVFMTKAFVLNHSAFADLKGGLWSCFRKYLTGLQTKMVKVELPMGRKYTEDFIGWLMSDA
jgi:hypothetical protein